MLDINITRHGYVIRKGLGRIRINEEDVISIFNTYREEQGEMRIEELEEENWELKEKVKALQEKIKEMEI